MDTVQYSPILHEVAIETLTVLCGAGKTFFFVSEYFAFWIRNKYHTNQRWNICLKVLWDSNFVCL